MKDNEHFIVIRNKDENFIHIYKSNKLYKSTDALPKSCRLNIETNNYYSYLTVSIEIDKELYTDSNITEFIEKYCLRVPKKTLKLHFNFSI